MRLKSRKQWSVVAVMLPLMGVLVEGACNAPDGTEFGLVVDTLTPSAMIEGEMAAASIWGTYVDDAGGGCLLR